MVALLRATWARRVSDSSPHLLRLVLWGGIEVVLWVIAAAAWALVWLAERAVILAVLASMAAAAAGWRSHRSVSRDRDSGLLGGVLWTAIAPLTLAGLLVLTYLALALGGI